SKRIMSAIRLPAVVNVTDWVAVNRDQFLPPVCNKMLHTDGQLKLFYVGGPNQRKDYHIEEGEELFYMERGDMELKMLIGNRFVSQPILQGQLFLLPGNLFHSPQRAADTIGWVIERERLASEIDGLRYFLETADGTPTLRPLFERYVHMRDLGSQVAEIIAEYRRSEEFRTGQPTKSASDNADTAAVAYKPELRPLPPVTLADWLDKHQQELDNAEVKNGSSSLEVFPSQCGYQFLVEVVGRSDGRQEFVEYNCETWLLQLVGECSVTFYVEKGQTATARRLGEKDSLLVPAGVAFGVVQSAGCRLLKASQDPGRKGY
ncbi:hypothetical protein BOX15_Mlig002979g3, partial [Macrostomum lignano]